MDARKVQRAVSLDPSWVEELKQAWSCIIVLAVWGDIKSSRLGALPKFRKRVLDVGEKLKSLCADRTWIPHPREQLKNALASSFNLKDSLLQMERSAVDIDNGSELETLSTLLVRLHELTLGRLAFLENQWASLLDSQYQDETLDSNSH